MKIITLISIATLVVSAQLSADPVIFPAQGQSAEQQDKDKYDCYNWGKQQSGFDPMSSSDTATAQAKTKSGGVLKGGLIGGATGAIVGNSSKNTRNAALGGAAIGGLAQAGSNQKSQQAAGQHNAQVDANRSNYDRNYAACLEGKGYTVK